MSCKQTVISFAAATLLIALFGVGDKVLASENNPSNPLANVSNTDVRSKYYDLGDSDSRYDTYLDGSYSFGPKGKLKYELHYWDTDVTGSNEKDWESLHLKLIAFPKKGKLGGWKYGVAVGLEWIEDFDNTDKGIGSGSDQIAPLVGVSLIPNPGTTLVPLIQQFLSYDGPNVNETTARLIGLQTLPKQFWTKMDLIVPFDWTNETIPATLELELGKMFSSSFGTYLDVELGIGSDRPYDGGAGLGLRYKY
jgi:hypothetical protein